MEVRVARMKMINVNITLVGIPEERRPLGALGVHEMIMIILKCILKKRGMRVWTILNCFKIGTSGRFS
jgi:hypothetical protein